MKSARAIWCVVFFVRVVVVVVVAISCVDLLAMYTYSPSHTHIECSGTQSWSSSLQTYAVLLGIQQAISYNSKEMRNTFTLYTFTSLYCIEYSRTLFSWKTLEQKWYECTFIHSQSLKKPDQFSAVIESSYLQFLFEVGISKKRFRPIIPNENMFVFHLKYWQSYSVCVSVWQHQITVYVSNREKYHLRPQVQKETAKDSAQ